MTKIFFPASTSAHAVRTELTRLYELFCVAIAQTESVRGNSLTRLRCGTLSTRRRASFSTMAVSSATCNTGASARCPSARGGISSTTRTESASVLTGYWLMQFDTNAPTLKVLNDRLRQDPRVIKWNTLKLGEKLGDIVPPGVSGGTTSAQARMGGRTVDYLG